MINFNCTSCGNCCKEENVALTIPEVLKYYKIFPLIGNVEIYYSTKEQLDSLYNPNVCSVRLNVNGKLMMASLFISTVPTPKGCIQLDKDNQCSMYDHKPHVCSMYPITLDHKVEDIQSRLHDEMNKQKSSQGDRCDGFDNASDVICVNGKLTNPDLEAIFLQRAKEDLSTKGIVVDYLTNRLVDCGLSELVTTQGLLHLNFPIRDLFGHYSNRGISLPVENIAKSQSDIALRVKNMYESEIIPTIKSEEKRNGFIKMLEMSIM